MRLLLGITGGIAAYKAAELTSRAIKAGFEVRAVMTPGATRFVTPLTFEALTGHPVLHDTFETGGSPGDLSAVRHVDWAKWATVTCIAPLTAATAGKLATGIADNALVTTWLAVPPEVPGLLCPAMNTRMWEHPSVQRSLDWLAQTGRYTLVPPTHKRLACGDVGMGGMAEVADVLTAIKAAVEG